MEDNDTTLNFDFVDVNELIIGQANKSMAETSKQRSDEFIQEVASVTKLLSKNESSKKIPLSVFKNIFLRIFTGEISEDNNPEEFHRIYNAYLAHAENIYNEVPVINPAGEIVFYIPALCNVELAAITTEKRAMNGQPTFSQVYSTTESIRASGREIEANNINDAFFESAVPDTKDAIIRHLIYAVRWNDICEICGVPPIYAELKEKMDAAVNGTSNENTVAETETKDVEDAVHNPAIDDYL